MIQPDPYAWLYAIDVPSDPPSKYRLSAYPQSIYFERDSLGAGLEYSPGSIGHEDVQLDTDGGIPRVRLTLQNVTREALAILETYDGLIGQKVRVVLVRVADGIDATPTVDEVYDVVESAATEDAVELTLGRAALTLKQFPDRQANRTHCAHRYGSAACGYDTARSGALQTCTKLRTGTNGCTAHGDDEVLASLPRLHPVRMLVFRGIPRTSGVGVS